METQESTIAQKAEDFCSRLGRLEVKFDALSVRVGRLETKFDVMSTNFAHLQSSMDDLKYEVRTTRRSTIGWTIGGVAIALSVAVGVILYVSGLNWDLAMKAFDRGNEANTKIEAMRLSEQWRQEALGRVAIPQPPTQQ